MDVYTTKQIMSSVSLTTKNIPSSNSAWPRKDLCLPSSANLPFRWRWIELSPGHGPRYSSFGLFLGRRDEGKGYPALLQAWPSVLQAIPDAVLILAGPGRRNNIETSLAKFPTANLRDLGVPDEISKANAIAGCDVFCLPSAHESFGIVYVDAWSYGKPVVCGTAPACREFIVDAKNGLWGNQVPEELAQKLITLLTRPDLRRAMGNAGKLEQAQKYNHEVFNRIHFSALGLNVRSS